MHVELRLLHQEDTMPFHVPVQEWLLSAPCAGNLAEMLVIAVHFSLHLTWQLAVTEEMGSKKFGDGDNPKLDTGLVLACFLQDAMVI